MKLLKLIFSKKLYYIGVKDMFYIKRGLRTIDVCDSKIKAVFKIKVLLKEV